MRSLLSQLILALMGSQLSFFEKCLNEKNNTSNLLSFEKLQDKCTKIFAKSIKKYDLFPHVDFFDVIDNEVSTILETIIVGKKDIKFGELIEKLKNSDWVKEGHELLKISSSVCPFCQQSINANLASEIESFFDETYELQKQELNTFHLNYKDYFLKKNSELENLYLLYEKYEGLIDFNIFNELIKKFTKRISENLFLIETKIKAPSKKIKLKSISEIVNQIEIVIKNFNTDITKNNTLVDNIKREKEILINEIWRFVVNEIRVDIDLYLRKTNGLSKGIVNLQEKLSKKNLDLKLCFEEIYDLETKISTVSTSVKEINRILTGFGFNNFQLAESTMGYYRVLREDGSEAKETLSEGEYNFITFLYFYYLIRGSFENNGIIKDKVIVIDDPISSLDSNVLFIVSNLVKIIRQNCLENVNGIKQLFVLTHNVYFHKEVTFLGSREKTSNKETFWVIKKLYKKSEIIKMSENPIKTTYELLWREIQDNEKTNPATIHNTLRRILEYYFNIIGGLKYEDCINKFEDEGKIICKSLVSWINDGSHFINDDLFIFDDNGGIEKYIVVFEEIFKKMGHHEHYKMMMKGKS